jgi:hypothetical protein
MSRGWRLAALLAVRAAVSERTRGALERAVALERGAGDEVAARSEMARAGERARQVARSGAELQLSARFGGRHRLELAGALASEEVARRAVAEARATHERAQRELLLLQSLERSWMAARRLAREAAAERELEDLYRVGVADPWGQRSSNLSDPCSQEMARVRGM